MMNRRDSPTIRRYLSLLLEPFFRWWWALSTGVISVASFVWVSENGWTVTRAQVAIATLIGATLLFLTFSVLVQGWELYLRGVPQLRVVSILKPHGHNDWIVVLSGALPSDQGGLVALLRRMGDVEVPFCLVEIRGRNSTGEYQGAGFSFAAGHLNDFSRGKFSAKDLVVHTNVQVSQVRNAVADFAP